MISPRQIRLFVVTVFALSTLVTPASAQVTRTTSPNANPSNNFLTSPIRVEQDVVPGERTTSRMSVQNDSPYVQDLSISTSDFGESEDPRALGNRVEDGEFGAGDWLTPEVTDLRIQPFETIEFDVYIDAPVDAPSGTNLGAIAVRGAAGEGPIGTADEKGPVVVDALVPFFLNVPGPVQHDLRITDIDTRDSFNFGSSRVTTWDVSFRNDGTVNEHVEGSVDVKSLFGTRAARIKIDPLLVLRGSTRTIRVVWRDVPWVGAFTPKVMVRGDDARLQTKTGDRLVVLPWWVIPAILLAILVPLGWMWLQRRRDWKLYLEDEGDGDVDPYDEPWDPAAPTHH